MRIYTCTPVAFGGGSDFFARDSGLLCRGLQASGVDSRAVMPGDCRSDDENDLIRTNHANLELVDWWKSLQVDGVVLYAWGSPKFRKVAAAIHQAGLFLVLNQDNSGLISPLAGWKDWIKEQWHLAGQGRDPGAWANFAAKAIKGATVGIFLTDPLRAMHLKQGDVIACVSPRAAEHYRKLCHVYGGDSLVRRVEVLPHAVETRFRHSGTPKRRQVACVGRWKDVVQKRPWLLIEVINALVAGDDDVSVVIAGEATGELQAWHEALNESRRERVTLAGKVDRIVLETMLAESQVFYSPSAFESFGIAAAEALCSGCSIVAGRSVSMAGFEWFVSEDSGTLTDGNHAAGHLAALKVELNAWGTGLRNAQKISEIWCDRVHADKVGARVVEMILCWKGSESSPR